MAARNNPEETVPEILNESSAYYVIGIERGTSARPDHARRITIKVRRKGVRVVAQREYAGLADRPAAAPGVPAAAPTPSLEEALSGLLPSADMPLSLALTPFASPEAGTPLVRISIDTAAFARSDGAPVPLDVVVVALNSVGQRVASARQTSTIAARRPASGLPIAIDVQSHLVLPPGDYGVRVAVSAAGPGTVASVFSDITVPDFVEAPLSLSGVSVELEGAAGPPVSTTRRRFKRTERIRAVLQMYQGTGRTDPLASASMRVRIIDRSGAAVHDRSTPYPASSFTNRRAGCVVPLPLGVLAPGDYVLKLDASAGRQTSGRALRFSVE